MTSPAEERDRFEAVLESMEEAVLAVDAEGRLQIINRAAKTLLGLPESSRGRLFGEVISVPELIDLLEAAASDMPVEAELELTTTGRRTVLARATPQPDGGAVLVLHDVSEIRRLETVRRDFVANVSHELRTPVSIIRANAETLLNGALERPEQARRFVDALLRHSDRLGRLISDLLDISRIEAGKYPINPQIVRVAPLVRRAFEAMEVRANEKSLTLASEIDDELSVLADPKALEQVILNLVENAVKYTQDDGHVRVFAERDASVVRVMVEDDGPGIDPIHRPRIFERFYRVDPGRSRDMGGTGLGLAIVKHLVEAMRGYVRVLPREPHGSVFCLCLPASEP